MDRNEPGAGERAARARTRRIWLIIGSLGGLGFVAGFATAMFEKDTPGMFPGALPPAFAIAMSIVLVVAILIGSWRYFVAIDEVERQNNYIASTWGLNFYLLAYPVWFLLWRGGLVAEPMHETLFLATVAVMMAVYLWTKFRN
ncbi:hypothetical protein [Sphingomonas sp.]|uniref:hypothetical protein n=1 Tax=Sphingomonas sp. TaxID=28214 RepID=UPI001D575316|nr:hypothetical protein [Sphingomonas sp.]MBX9797578.1 hypothetical protein [Sphingomonas sp.]